MSDTVKLIIEIPKEDYERCKKKYQRRIDIMGDAIANGTPLDKIRAEIEHMIPCVLDIIDKYKAEKGGEE